MFIATLSLNSLECNFVTTFNCFHPETGETESVAKARGRNLDVIWKGKFFYSVGDKERFGWEEIPAGIDIYDTREGLYHAYKLYALILKVKLFINLKLAMLRLR